MRALKKQPDLNLFRQLVPLDALDDAARAELAQRSRIEHRDAGQLLFQKGDTARVSIYLLDGEVSLSSPLSPEERIRAGAAAARYPLAHHLPRAATARAVSRTRLLVIDGDVAEIVAGPATDHARAAWKTAWLEAPLFRRLPRGRLDELLTRMEEIAVQAGQVVIHQDETADSYYVIKQGRCSVSRRPAPRARDVKLAELGPGQGFGEEALITNATRNASITMIEDGVLLRLGKEDFIASLARPLLRHMPFDELVAHGNAVLVDVRTPEEFETDGIIGSLNMPMPVLRLKAHRLDPRRAYVVYSNTGHFSTAAAFILLQQGLDAYVLKGGLSAAPRHRLKHPRSYRPDDAPAHGVVDFPAQPRGPAGDEAKLRFDWVSDEAMWRNTIGLRADNELESLFTPSDMYRHQAVDTSLQGFEEVRLFTTVGTGATGLTLAADEAAGTQASYTAGGRPATARAGTGPVTAAAGRGLGRGGSLALAALMLTIGFAAAYWTNDQLRFAVSELPVWIQKQRDLDSKLSRLLDNIERLPALQAGAGTPAAQAEGAVPGNPAR